MVIVECIGQKFSRYLLILMILLGALSFSPSDTYAQTPAPTLAQINLWHAYTGEQQTALDTLVTQFNAENEWGITVTATSMENTGRLYDQIIINLLADGYRERLPNLILTNPDTAALFALSGNILELTPYLSELEDVELLPDVLTLGQNAQGQQFMLPTHLHTEVLVINENALAEIEAEPPTIPTEFGTLACQFRQEGGWSGGKFGAVWGAYLPMRGNFVAALLTAQGNTPYALNSTSWQFDTSENAELLSILASYHQEACTTVTDNPTIALDDFVAGKSLFYFAHTSELPNIEIGIASNFVDSFTWGVYSLLADNSAPQWVDAQGLSVIVHDEAQDLASWRFINWLISEHVHFSTWIQATGGFPIRVDVGAELAENGEMASQWGQTWALLKSEHVHKPILASGEVLYFEIESAWRRIYINFSNPMLELDVLDTTLNEIMVNFGDG